LVNFIRIFHDDRIYRRVELDIYGRIVSFHALLKKIGYGMF
jgi:hypothetical protein